MKKMSLVGLIVFFMSGLLFTSCEECTTCTEANSGYTADEYCGSKSQVDDYEAELKSQGAAVGQDWYCTRD